MGNFFSSPQQRAGESLYSAAVSGHPIGEAALQKLFGGQLSALRGETSGRIGEVAGDIQARSAASGFTPGSANEGLISKASAPILGQEQVGIEKLGAEQQNQLMQMILQQLGLGLQALPSSSPFGDILGSLTTLGNLGVGAGSLLRGLNTGTSTFGGDNLLLSKPLPARGGTGLG